MPENETELAMSLLDAVSQKYSLIDTYRCAVKYCEIHTVRPGAGRGDGIQLPLEVRSPQRWLLDLSFKLPNYARVAGNVRLLNGTCNGYFEAVSDGRHSYTLSPRQDNTIYFKRSADDETAIDECMQRAGLSHGFLLLGKRANFMGGVPSVTKRYVVDGVPFAHVSYSFRRQSYSNTVIITVSELDYAVSKVGIDVSSTFTPGVFVEMDFSDGVVNPPLACADFNFAPPAGMRLEKEHGT